MSIALVVGLCPGFAYADELVAGSLEQTDVVDVSDSVLQVGGLNSEKAPVRTKLRALSAVNVSGFEAALSAAAEKWSGGTTVEADVSSFGVTIDNVGSLISGFCNRNPQFFFLSGACSYSYSSNAVIKVSLKVDASYSTSDVAKFKAAANAALSGVESGWTDEQKALYLHDWVVTHCEYDKSLKRHSAYDVLVVGSAVCQGYALAYDYLLGRAGVGCDTITSRGINHAWNLVTIGGKTYYADCTWDDPSNILFESYCGHENFLRSKGAFGHVGKDSANPVTDWVDTSGASVYGSSSIASSTAYDSAYWSDVATAIPHVGSLWAYVNKSESGSAATVYVHDYATGENRALVGGLDAQWFVFGGKSSLWSNHYTCLISNGDAFIASTPTSLIEVSPNGVKKEVYSLGASEVAAGYVYGLMYDPANGQCRYQIGEGPNGAVKKTGVWPTIAVESVSLSKKSLSLAYGKTAQLSAKIAPANATNKSLKWSSTNNKVAKVSSSGKVTAVGVGSATVKATTVDGGFSATCKVTVGKAANPMNVVAKAASVKYNKKKASTVKAAAAYNFKKKAVGAVSYARVAKGSSKWLTVNKKTGNITVKAGAPKGKTQTIVVKVSAKGNGNYKAVSKTVAVKVKVK